MATLLAMYKIAHGVGVPAKKYWSNKIALLLICFANGKWPTHANRGFHSKSLAENPLVDRTLRTLI